VQYYEKKNAKRNYLKILLFLDFFPKTVHVFLYKKTFILKNNTVFVSFHTPSTPKKNSNESFRMGLPKLSLGYLTLQNANRVVAQQTLFFP
jgi:hypothetical protein